MTINPPQKARHDLANTMATLAPEVDPTGQTKRQQDIARARKALKAKGDSAYLKRPMI